MLPLSISRSEARLCFKLSFLERRMEKTDAASVEPITEPMSSPSSREVFSTRWQKSPASTEDVYKRQPFPLREGYFCTQNSNKWKNAKIPQNAQIPPFLMYLRKLLPLLRQKIRAIININPHQMRLTKFLFIRILGAPLKQKTE